MKSLTAVDFIKACGANKLLNTIQEKGISVSLTTKQLKLVCPETKKTSTVNVSINLLGKAKNGTLTPVDKEGYQVLLADAVGKIIAADPNEPSDVDVEALLKEWNQTQVPPASGHNSAPKPPPEPSPTVYKDVVEPAKSPKMPAPMTVKEATAAVPIPLRDATRLYQPVKSTSEGSRYYLIAARKDLRMAVRILGDKVSCRVEGKGIEGHVSRLQEAGFATHIGDGTKPHYASVHVVADGPTKRHKTLGALVMGLGLDFDTPMFSTQTLEKLPHA